MLPVSTAHTHTHTHSCLSFAVFSHFPRSHFLPQSVLPLFRSLFLSSSESAVDSVHVLIRFHSAPSLLCAILYVKVCVCVCVLIKSPPGPTPPPSSGLRCHHSSPSTPMNGELSTADQHKAKGLRQFPMY